MAEPPTEAEKPILLQFREMLKDDGLENYRLQDYFLLRWLRARNMDLDKAAQMLRTSMAWRKENKVDSVLYEPINKEICDLIDGYLQAIDTKGRPVVALPGGEWDVRKPLDDGRKPELLRFLIQALEIFEQTMDLLYNFEYPQKLECHITKFTVIIDLKHFTYAKFAHKKSVEALIDLVKIYEANYPETLGRAVIINSPRIFSMLFALIKPFLSENTVSKISIFDSNEKAWRKEIESIVNPDQLPVRYGGNKINATPSNLSDF